MCQIYDFQKAKQEMQGKRMATAQEKELVKKIVDCAMTGAVELTLWEDTGDEKYFQKACSQYKLMNTLRAKLEKITKR